VGRRAEAITQTRDGVGPSASSAHWTCVGRPLAAPAARRHRDRRLRVKLGRSHAAPAVVRRGDGRDDGHDDQPASGRDVHPEGASLLAIRPHRDTIVVAIRGKQYHLRYIGMDTPESVKPDTPVERMALEATAANKALVAGRNVVLEKDVSETDRFGRLLRNVWVERDGRLVLVGLELVRAGYANVTTFPPDVKYVDQLLAALDEARAAGAGLWAANATP